MKDAETIAVWFSCGAASATAAYYALKDYPGCNVRIVNNPIAEEDDDNRRFLRDVEVWLGVEIEFAKSKQYPSQRCADVWEKRKFMSGPLGAPCTVALKKEARQEWEAEHRPDHHVLGFTFDEKKRHERFVLTERSNVLPVLINHKMTKAMCIGFVESQGLRLPNVYKLGYPNANCIGCVKATSPTYWNLVRKTHPQVFLERSEQSRRIGAKLVRVDGKRIFLDELDPDETGRPVKSADLSCGLFCEE